MIRCSDNSLYTGITTDPKRRFIEHKNHQGAKYFYAHRPVKLVYMEIAKNRSEASIREYSIKKLTVNKKQLLILSSENKITESTQF
jgi:putative endonuclease